MALIVKIHDARLSGGKNLADERSFIPRNALDIEPHKASILINMDLALESLGRLHEAKFIALGVLQVLLPLYNTISLSYNKLIWYTPSNTS
jgi:hypothetical protein